MGSEKKLRINPDLSNCCIDPPSPPKKKTNQDKSITAMGRSM